MRFVLPYPPSINHYWRNVRGRTLISAQGREYRGQVARWLSQMRLEALDDHLAVRLQVFPPDRRRRDLDNVQKPLLDALSGGIAYEDDSQIDWLLTERMPVEPPGHVVVSLTNQLERCPACRQPMFR